MHSRPCRPIFTLLRQPLKPCIVFRFVSSGAFGVPLTLNGPSLLANNRLTTLPAELLSATTRVRAVSLSHNQLVDLPAGLLAATAALVTDVRLGDNALTGVPAALLRGAVALQTLYVAWRAACTVTVPLGVTAVHVQGLGQQRPHRAPRDAP